MAKRFDDLEDTVQENSHAIIEHADALSVATKETNTMMEKVDGAVQEMKKQVQRAESQFEALKAFIENQRKPTVNAGPYHPTYADKATTRDQRRDPPRRNADQTQRPVADQCPP